MSELPDEKAPSSEKGPVFIQPCAGTTGGSNPALRSFRWTLLIGDEALSLALTFGIIECTAV